MDELVYGLVGSTNNYMSATNSVFFFETNEARDKAFEYHTKEYSSHKFKKIEIPMSIYKKYFEVEPC